MVGQNAQTLRHHVDDATAAKLVDGADHRSWIGIPQRWNGLARQEWKALLGLCGTGNLEITIRTMADLEKAKPLIERSYEAS